MEMPTAVLAGDYKATVDLAGSGNSPGVPLTFNGFCYASGQQGTTVWTVFLRPTGRVGVDRRILQTVAREKLKVSYLRHHCID
jgi:hypothetical protein